MQRSINVEMPDADISRYGRRGPVRSERPQKHGLIPTQGVEQRVFSGSYRLGI